MAQVVVKSDPKWTFRDAVRIRNAISKTYPRGWFTTDRLLLVVKTDKRGGASYDWSIVEWTR